MDVETVNTRCPWCGDQIALAAEYATVEFLSLNCANPICGRRVDVKTGRAVKGPPDHQEPTGCICCGQQEFK